MKNKNTFFSSLILILIVASVFGASRVTFSRPGPMMKIPFTTTKSSPYWFTIGVASDVYDFSPQLQTPSAYFDMFVTPDYNFGLTYATVLDSANTPKSEFGIHLQRRVYDYKGVSISFGLQDILFSEGSDIDPKKISAYMVFSSEKRLGDYKLTSFMGFGSGKIGNDPHLISDDDNSVGGVFVGFLFNTPYLKKNGGMDFVGEYIGSGINMGVHIPITPNYRFDIGVTHFEKFGSFGSLESADSTLTTDAPSISLGFSMAVPKPIKEKLEFINGSELPISNIANDNVNAINETILRLRDSVKVNQNTIENLSEHRTLLEQKISNLIDSTRVLHLENMVTESNLNASLRHLARSLRFYYEGQYHQALQEAEQSLQITPSLALAYARRGSIYYKLGDTQKATINWNLALKLDPEYEEVRLILQALKENRLESASLINNKEG
ncbi:MAG: tetratricopeptide repeat protein [Candidatus Marinimicrobia bacterium]|nr:tetratricopeptide repeat protein [Candidatus Neomarinimicrobiota bacterium]MBL7023591.1 tetratricopeptide repeat protein [Candidatus Neomarinimicrobiota bacterium]MBL7109521.1 tetratricopeptide repeat protein [Candidatus Neomarinimicrobiota bacterium]